ncbi:aminotransferase class IV family protein [Rhizobium tumorigenes]|uniref:Probable branched-chain-amino-acid aminotransferase n=1 Tax=Rhizobium tumorigenes TaxID=2041385 RepID=A0AAF1KS42_9HYPH|nr:aminotransferase class IV family protein [Rhizobium tumorigenes]WFR94541.1 aminotransferase class IV family protein [Rhizobium tumorigenes]
MLAEGAVCRGGRVDSPVDDFSLIETLRYEPGLGFLRLKLHLARLQRSARRLGFAAPEQVEAALDAAVCDASSPQRVRLTMNRTGTVAVTTAGFVPLAADVTWRVRIAATRLDSSEKLLRAKTTRRGVYDRARAEFSPDEADEVLLLNKKGDVCEGTITSVFVDDGSGMLLTPPIACGLLAGVLRSELICARKARTSRLTVSDLAEAKLYVGNSLRGLIPAIFVQG